jgi:DNA polymerase-1
MAKLLAIDGMALVRRIYEAGASSGSAASGSAAPGLASDQSSEAEQAEQAFASMRASFTRLLQHQSPSHVLLAFDVPGPTWRHALFPAYKAHRPETPALLRQGLPEFYALLQSWGLQVLQIPGVEADDVIATGVLRWLREARGEAVIASSDKDLHCLIAEGALLWDHFKNEAHDRHWVEQKFGVGPELLVDLLAFVGDAADNIPGVPKIGIKTAAKLLRAYGSLDGVMAGAGILSDAMGQRLRAGREQLYLSRQLLTLKTDVTLGVSWKTLVWPTNH